MKYLIAALLFTSACAMTGDDGTDVEQESSSTRYVPISEFEKIDQGAWFDHTRSLNAQFDDICGDTFCEGDYANLTPLTFQCAVTSKAGNIKDCAWTFAASMVEVDSRTAKVLVDAPTFECHIAMKTTATKLVALLSTADSLHAALPGAPAATPSIYDQLSECFEHPVGSTAMELSTTGTETYISSRDYYTSSTGLARWRAARTAIDAGFDNVCGDTFCSSDYGDLQSMDLQCAVTKSSGNVKTCSWVFGGSYFFVPERTGVLESTHQSFTCSFDVKGTLSQLITTWTAPGPQSAIRRTLPGMTTTAYDALLGCLP